MYRSWRKIPCKKSDLRLDINLKCGQAFRWKEHTPGIWRGVIRNYAFKLAQDDNYLYYQVFPSVPNECGDSKGLLRGCDHDIKTEIQEDSKGSAYISKVLESEPEKSEKSLRDHLQTTDLMLKDYFRLDINLKNLYKEWSSRDPHFAKVAKDFECIRMLKQDPVENLFTFICSSNNNIQRITQMVDNLCKHYGELITKMDDEFHYAFPSVPSLAQDAVETKLRELGFGYRAKFIAGTAKQIYNEHGDKWETWLCSLKNKQYDEVREELIRLPGIGGKIADCVCLMSLDKLEAVPIDTHILQLAAKHYLPKLSQTKSLTDSVYRQTAEYFRSLWGPYAGWTQAVLFCAELKFLQKEAENGKVPQKSAKRKKADESASNKKVKQPKQKEVKKTRSKR